MEWHAQTLGTSLTMRTSLLHFGRVPPKRGQMDAGGRARAGAQARRWMKSWLLRERPRMETTLSRTRMTMTKPKSINWLPDVEERDYPAAESYLSLLYGKKRVAEMVGKLKRAPVVHFKAKDIFRASQLSLLGVSNSHVEKDRTKIRKGKGLSPVLLVRDRQNAKVVIADGYHRLCAIYQVNEDAWIHCKIV